MRVFVVTKMGVLGQEPVAVFNNWDDADEFCVINDDHFEDPTQSIFDVKSFTVNALEGTSLDELDDTMGDTGDYRDEDEDEDYDD